MPFQRYQAPDLLSQDALPRVIPAPPGRDVAPFIKELAQEIPAELQKLGTLTPWAVREGDIRWAQVVQPSSVNIEVYALSDAKIQELYREHYMLELPYVAAVFEYPPTIGELQQAFESTLYDPVEVTAVYSQDDRAAVPTPVYMVWLHKEEEVTGSRKHRGSVEQAALRLKGRLVYAQQVPAAHTTKRGAPSASYAEAGSMHRVARQVKALPESLPAASTLPAYQPVAVGADPPAVPATPPTTEKSSMTPYYLLGGGLAAGILLYMVVRK